MVLEFCYDNGLNRGQLDSLEGCSSSGEVKKMLDEFLGGSLKLSDAMTEIVVDFHFYNYDFCKSQGFNYVATSTFIAIMKEVLLHDMSDSEFSLVNSFNFFEELVFKHSVHSPPNRIKIFERAQVSAIFDYAVTSYFGQYRLYKYLFCPKERAIVEQSGS